MNAPEEAGIFDISALRTCQPLLHMCYQLWQLRGFEGLPPDPHEVAYQSEYQNEVAIYSNLVHARKKMFEADNKNETRD